MRAVIRRNGKLVVDQMATPQPGPGQMVVKTLVCGICGSDLHALHHMEHMIELGRRGGIVPYTHILCATVRRRDGQWFATATRLDRAHRDTALHGGVRRGDGLSAADGA